MSEADRLAKLVPDTPGIAFKETYEKVPALVAERIQKMNSIATTLKYAEVSGRLGAGKPVFMPVASSSARTTWRSISPYAATRMQSSM
ncbi:MAG: hypothetical protein MZV63_31320 [Marinilabiliales bacterium]|nr:hypothetical protein [Marinilabiliales bacterium]